MKLRSRIKGWTKFLVYGYKLLLGKNLNKFRKLISQTISYKNYNLYSQWDFVYMHYCLKESKLKFDNKYQDSIFRAKIEDLGKIKVDLYPKMKDKYDRKYFSKLGEPGLDCFLCEKNGKLIHYSWIFYDILISPLAKTPLGTMGCGNNVVFWGPTFTVPEERGIIYPYIFSKIVKYLRKQNKYHYLINFCHKKNKGAIPFYKNLGFIELVNQPKPTLIIKALRFLDVSLNRLGIF